MNENFMFSAIFTVLLVSVISYDCPEAQKFGPGPPMGGCEQPTDPLSKPEADLESWLTKEMFYDLFPKANLGYGAGNSCSPYSYESFVIAARYFPEFGSEHVTTNPKGDPIVPAYSKEMTNKRDVSAFFAHSVQETGENDANLFNKFPLEKAKQCFYRGGLYNWFEGGEACFTPDCGTPEGGDTCKAPGKYWATDATNQYFYPVNNKSASNGLYKGCYFGRGTIQISYNFNYGPFSDYLNKLGIRHEGKPIDLLENPNLVMTKKDPPLAFMASLWFYMTPQPPKPAMHDIVIGNWVANEIDVKNNMTGPILGPTSLVINNECGGESANEPGPGGENRRIKAFRFFCEYFDVPVGTAQSLSCKDFSGFLKSIRLSFDADWKTTWKEGRCNCTGQTYPGPIPYFDEDFFPEKWSALNSDNKEKCENALWDGWQDATTQCKGRTFQPHQNNLKETYPPTCDLIPNPVYVNKSCSNPPMSYKNTFDVDFDVDDCALFFQSDSCPNAQYFSYTTYGASDRIGKLCFCYDTCNLYEFTLENYVVYNMVCAVPKKNLKRIPETKLPKINEDQVNVIGYYGNSGNAVSSIPELENINSVYNVLIFTFANWQNGKIIIEIQGPYTPSTLKAAISTWKSVPDPWGRSKHALISFGGQNGNWPNLDDTTLVQKIHEFLTTFNFDGIDIDLESSTVNGVIKNHNAFVTLKRSFNYIMTAAPEAAQYPMNAYASLLPLLDWVHPQFYNNPPSAIAPPYAPEDAWKYHSWQQDGFWAKVMNSIAETCHLDSSQKGVAVPASTRAAGSYNDWDFTKLASTMLDHGIKNVATWALAYDNEDNWKLASAVEYLINATWPTSGPTPVPGSTTPTPGHCTWKSIDPRATDEWCQSMKDNAPPHWCECVPDISDMKKRQKS